MYLLLLKCHLNLILVEAVRFNSVTLYIYIRKTLKTCTDMPDLTDYILRK